MDMRLTFWQLLLLYIVLTPIFLIYSIVVIPWKGFAPLKDWWKMVKEAPRELWYSG